MENQLRIKSSVFPDNRISESEWNNQFNVSKMYMPEHQLFQHNLMNHDKLSIWMRDKQSKTSQVNSLLGTKQKYYGKIQQVYRFGIQSIKRRLR